MIDGCGRSGGVGVGVRGGVTWGVGGGGGCARGVYERERESCVCRVRMGVGERVWGRGGEGGGEGGEVRICFEGALGGWRGEGFGR